MWYITFGEGHIYLQRICYLESASTYKWEAGHDVRLGIEGSELTYSIQEIGVVLLA